MSVVSWHRIADDLTKQVRELQADLAAMTAERDELRKAIRYLAADFNDLGERCGAAESALAAAREEARKWEWSWDDLRQRMRNTAKVGIDIYVRQNAADFLRMMDQALARYQPRKCYLCRTGAFFPADRGRIFYRLFDIDIQHWESKEICAVCFAKLRGPAVVPVRVLPEDAGTVLKHIETAEREEAEELPYFAEGTRPPGFGLRGPLGPSTGREEDPRG